jgi:hypothetical protein
MTIRHINYLSNIEKIATSEKLLFHINRKFSMIFHANKYHNQK